MTREEAINRWMDIASTVFWAEEGIANEWHERLKAAPSMTKELQHQLAQDYCRAIAEEVVSKTIDVVTVAKKENLSPEITSLLKLDVKEIDFSIRTLNILKANDLNTVADICRLHKIDWLRLRHGGKRTLMELDNFLTAHGLTWGMDV